MATQATVKQQATSNQIVTVNTYMEQNKSLISKALPAHITAERLIAMFTIVIQSNPALANCSQASLIGALVQTAQLGLIPGNVSHCYYVPFNNKGVQTVQFILGYKGMVELVNRSKSAAILSTEVVYENDKFDYALGLNPRLEHTPTSGERGGIKGVYCIAKNLMANEKLFIFLTKEDIEKVRKASKAGNSEYSPWANWYEEMAKKTAIKRICKLLPLAIDIQKKLATDETVKTQVAPDMTDVKDETTWEDGQFVDESQIDQPVNAPTSSPTENHSPSDSPKEAVNSPVNAVLPQNMAIFDVGQVIPAVIGTLESFDTRKFKKKDQSEGTLTKYVLKEGGFIKKWGESNFNAGDQLLFINVKVEEFKGEKQFQAEKIDPVIK